MVKKYGILPEKYKDCFRLPPTLDSGAVDYAVGTTHARHKDTQGWHCDYEVFSRGDFFVLTVDIGLCKGKDGTLLQIGKVKEGTDLNHISWGGVPGNIHEKRKNSKLVIENLEVEAKRELGVGDIAFFWDNVPHRIKTNNDIVELQRKELKKENYADSGEKREVIVFNFLASPTVAEKERRIKLTEELTSLSNLIRKSSTKISELPYTKRWKRKQKGFQARRGILKESITKLEAPANNFEKEAVRLREERARRMESLTEEAESLKKERAERRESLIARRASEMESLTALKELPKEDRDSRVKLLQEERDSWLEKLQGEADRLQKDRDCRMERLREHEIIRRKERPSRMERIEDHEEESVVYSQKISTLRAKIKNAVTEKKTLEKEEKEMLEKFQQKLLEFGQC